MTLECENRLVSEVLLLTIQHAVSLPVTIVKARVLPWESHALELVIRDRLADVPHFKQLVFSV